jgi:hypothetical protein
MVVAILPVFAAFARVTGTPSLTVLVTHDKDHAQEPSVGGMIRIRIPLFRA